MNEKLEFIRGFEEALDLCETAINNALRVTNENMSSLILTLHVAKLYVAQLKQDMVYEGLGEEMECDGNCEDCILGQIIDAIEASQLFKKIIKETR